MSITVIQWNARGVRAHLGDLQLLTRRFNPDVLCLQETNLTVTDRFHLPGYTTYRQDFVDGLRACGGVATLVRRTIHSQITPSPDLPQALTVELTTLGHTLTIVNTYIPHPQRLTNDTLRQAFSTPLQQILYVGDWNSHHPAWGSPVSDAPGAIIHDTAVSSNLHILNTGTPTYLHPATGSLTHIDLAFCSQALLTRAHWWVIDDQYGSDHFPTVTTITYDVTQDTSPKPPKWRLQDADWDKFNSTLNIPSPDILNNMDADQACVLLEESLNMAAKESIPLTRTHKKCGVYWWTPTIGEAIKNRKRALRAFKKHPSAAKLEHYKRTKATARRLIIHGKRTAWQNYISKLNHSTPLTEVWKVINTIRHKRTRQIITGLFDNNSLSVDKSDFPDLLAHQYYNISSIPTTDVPPRFPLLPTPPVDSFQELNTPFTFWEISTVLNSMRNSAPGSDSIPSAFLTHLNSTNRRRLLHFYNHLFLHDILPQQWREATVIPILKPSTDPTRPTSYRPIALTSHIGKLFERLITTRLVHHIETNQLLSDQQHGFRRYRTTNTPITLLQNAVLEGFTSNQFTSAIFFDLNKAFDTASRPHILYQLQCWGLQGHIFHYIQNFLDRRIFRTSVNGQLSQYYIQERGVPQGSVISPILFIILMDSITKVILPSVQICLFADDILLYMTHPSIQTIQHDLQTTINNIQPWATDRGLTFSSIKTKSMTFFKHRQQPNALQLTLHGQPIDQVDQHRFLGLTFDRMLSWRPHITILKTACQKRLDLLRSVSGTRWGADRKTLLTFHKAFILSKLLYGSCAYTSAHPNTLQSLNSVHHAGLRIALGAFRSSPIRSLIVEASSWPLELFWDREIINFYYRLRCSPCGAAARSLTLCHPREHIFLTQNPLKIGYPLNVRITIALTKYGLARLDPRVESWPPFPPSVTFRPNINTSLSKYKKDITCPKIYCTEFRFFQTTHPDAEYYYTDGSKSMQGVGAAVISPRGSFQTTLNSSASVYSAELHAIELAVELINDQNSIFPTPSIICTDSLSSLSALENPRSCNPIISSIRSHLYQQTLSSYPNTILTWIPGHVGIPGNVQADQAAKVACTLPPNENLICRSDLKLAVTEALTTYWNRAWTEILPGTVKLRDIRNSTAEWSTASHETRRREVLLTRLRIGHTRLTHGHHMTRTPPPICNLCNTPLTVQHILESCIKYNRLRQKHQLSPFLKDILQDSPVSSDNLFNFLLDTKLHLEL